MQRERESTIGLFNKPIYMTRETKKLEGSGVVTEAEKLLTELGVDIGTVKEEIKLSLDEAIARRDELASENKRLNEEVEKLERIVAVADAMLVKDIPVAKKEQLEEKAKEIRALLEQVTKEFERNAGELTNLESSPEVYGAVQERAAKEHEEIDPLAKYEAEVKVQRKNVYDILVKIVDLWKKDNGRFLHFQTEVTNYSPEELRVLTELEEARQRLIEVGKELHGKKYFKGKLEKKRDDLGATIKELEGKTAGWSKGEEVYAEKSDLESQLNKAASLYVSALEKMNDVIKDDRLPVAKRDKYKAKAVDKPYATVQSEFPVYSHGPNYYVDHTKLFEQFGYKREVPKKK